MKGLITPGFVPTSPSKANVILAAGESPKKLAQRAAMGVKDAAEFDAMVRAEMDKMEEYFCTTSMGGGGSTERGGERGALTDSLFGAAQDTGMVEPNYGAASSARGVGESQLRRAAEQDRYNASLGTTGDQAGVMAQRAMEQRADGAKAVDFNSLPNPTRHVRQQPDAVPAGPTGAQVIDTFTIGGNLSPGDARRNILSKRQEYAQQLDLDKQRVAIEQPRKLLRRPSEAFQDKDDDMDPFKHHKRQPRASRAAADVQPANLNAPPVRNEKSLMRQQLQRAEQASHAAMQASSGLVFSEERVPRADAHSMRHERERQYGEELRQEMVRKEASRREARAMDGTGEPSLPRKVLPENHQALQARHSPVDPFFSLGENGMISSLGAGDRSSNEDVHAKRLEQAAYAQRIQDDQQARLRVQAEANVTARYGESTHKSPSGVTNIGARDASIDDKRDKQRQYQEQLERDQKTQPIVRDRILLRHRRHVGENEDMYASYQTARSETSDWQEKRKMQEEYYNQLRTDDSIGSVEDRSLDDYERDAMQLQHLHRERYAQHVMRTSNNPTADFSVGHADYRDNASYVDPIAEEQASRRAAGSAAAYAKQLQDQAREAREFAEAEAARGMSSGPKLPNPEELTQRRRTQMAYAKKLREDSQTAAMVMAMPAERVPIKKKDDGLGDSQRAPSRKVQEYHARQEAYKALQEQELVGSLGDLQQGSPYKTRERIDGEGEMERGYRATGYGANRGPNPRQQPYINEDDIRIRNEQKRKQAEYARALDEAKTMKPIEDSRESWVRQDYRGNGLPNDDGIRVHYPPPFPGTLTGTSPQKSRVPMNAVHLGHGFQHDGQFQSHQVQPQLQQDFARGF